MSTAIVITARFHLGIYVSDLSRSVRFYRTLFGTDPTMSLGSLARFESHEPPLLLSLTQSRITAGGPLNHVGIRLHDSIALVEIQRRLEEAGIATQRQEGVECCYAKQTKFWVTDPDRVLWELYVLEADIDQSGFDDPPSPRSAEFVAWPHADDGQPRSQIVIYRGPLETVTGDDGTVFPRGRRVAVTQSVRDAIRGGPAAEQFILFPQAKASSLLPIAQVCCDC
jgi:catechol 2,3-dioxygenase-like lactoylglutathione lyase family enzyme